MPLSLLRFGFSSRIEPDFPPHPKLKSSYDVVIIGGGGHGVAIAYYLAKVHGITNVAVLEKGYLGGGSTTRNTAVVRSNYLTPEGVKFYIESVKLFRDLSNEFDFNIMYSERGQLRWRTPTPRCAPSASAPRSTSISGAVPKCWIDSKSTNSFPP